MIFLLHWRCLSCLYLIDSLLSLFVFISSHHLFQILCMSLQCLINLRDLLEEIKLNLRTEDILEVDADYLKRRNYFNETWVVIFVNHKQQWFSLVETMISIISRSAHQDWEVWVDLYFSELSVKSSLIG